MKQARLFLSDFKQAALLPSLLFLGLGLLMLWRLQDAPAGDYANYYFASRFFLEGHFDAGVYDPAGFNLALADRGVQQVFVNYAPVPPFSVLAYLPFALIGNWAWSKMVFSVGGLLLFCLSLYRLLWREPSKRPAWLAMLPFLFALPLFNNLAQGQSYLWLLFFILEGYLQRQSGQNWLAGFLWAFPIALKLFPALLILYPLLNGERRLAAWVAVFSVVFSILPLALLPLPITLDYFTKIAPRLMSGEINDPFTILYQSGRSFFDRLLVYDAQLNPAPWRELPALAAMLNLLYQSLILLGVSLQLLQTRLSAGYQIGLLLFASILLSGYGSSYGLLVLFPLSLFIPGLLLKTRQLLAAGMLLGLANTVPVYLLHDWPVLLQFPRWYALLGLFLLLMAAIPLRRKLAGKLALTLLLLFILRIPRALPSQSRSQYYLPDKPYGIIYRYAIEEGYLRLFFVDGNGPAQAILPLPDHLRPDPNLIERKERIYFQGLLLSPPGSRSRQASRLGENQVLYLSDEGRGPGFFTLRTRSLP